ncbi:hypothetical protein PSP6_540020 [Paraburkholderia tropica]|uniref:hypothetical protein n=1 Tax=Paraburkholderia tropica TaxID=92647 RepID=UPI001CB57ACD|nr:hypothetical protein [Paraburkholderia tropica]CAG9229934.1 hypothetical protein PSP6_540020 [Paraburkholderia tropica]
MQVLGLFGVFLGEFALRFLLLLYAVPFFFMVVGYRFYRDGQCAQLVAADSVGVMAARKQSVDGGKVMLLGLALAVLVFYRVELFRCAVHLF